MLKLQSPVRDHTYEVGVPIIGTAAGLRIPVLQDPKHKSSYPPYVPAPLQLYMSIDLGPTMPFAYDQHFLISYELNVYFNKFPILNEGEHSIRVQAFSLINPPEYKGTGNEPIGDSGEIPFKVKIPEFPFHQ